MARTTSEAVEAIIEIEVDYDLTPFITVANAMVTQHCTDSDYSDATLELIERWLSAHVYTTYDPRFETEKAGSVGAKYQSSVDIGLNNSQYGQMAMRIDYEGNLAALDKRIMDGRLQAAGMTWLGLERDEVTDE